METTVAAGRRAHSSVARSAVQAAVVAVDSATGVLMTVAGRTVPEEEATEAAAVGELGPRTAAVPEVRQTEEVTELLLLPPGTRDSTKRVDECVALWDVCNRDQYQERGGSLLTRPPHSGSGE